MRIAAPPGSAFIEDIFAAAGKTQRAVLWLAARMLPARLLLKFFSARKSTPDSIATVVSSEGSTGAPKRAMLSHFNLIANIESMGQVFSTGVSDGS